MPSHVSRILRSHIFWRVVLLTIVSLAFFRRSATRIGMGGDEPHYLLGVVSLVEDGDANVYNNYANQDYRKFGYPYTLRPQLKEIRPGVIITEHGVGFPLLLAIPWKIGKLTGVHGFLFSVALLAILLVARCCDLLSGSLWTGTLAGLLLGFCPTWLMHSRLVFPECTAGFATALISLLLIRLSRNPEAQRERFRPFLLGLLFFFPAVYLRYAPLIVPLYLMVPFSPVLRRMRWLYVGLGAGALLVLAVQIRFPGPGSIVPLVIGVVGLTVPTALTGCFGRLWNNWFDRSYGLVVYTPWVILVPWAVVYFRPRFRPFRIGYAESAALAVLGYCLMFGPWNLGPGSSVAGRYLCSAIPLMAILVALWCGRGSSLLNERTAVVGALLCVSVVFVVVSIWRWTAPFGIFAYGYPLIYGEYWDAVGDRAANSSGLPGMALLSLVVVTKRGAIYWSRRAGGGGARVAAPGDAS